MYLCSAATVYVAPPVRSESSQKSKQTNTPDFSSVRKLIQDRMAKEAVPGLAVAVVRRGEILWEEGFGWADRENRIPANEQTMFYLASVTKAITATAILVLHERKKLDLDHPINDYLGPARLSSPLWDVNAATVRRVASHTAGLTTYARSCYGSPMECRISNDETIQRYGIVFWPPGDHFDYSNLGYGILGTVVARVSGKSYSDFLRNEIFWPLGMTHASLGLDPKLEKFMAKRYSSEFGARPVAISGTPGASAVYCSAHDLALFAMFHLKTHRPFQKKVLSDVSIDTMQELTSPNHGMGWSIQEDLFGYRGVLGQGGTDDAYARLQLIPSEGIAVIVLANTGTLLPDAVVNEVLETLLPAYRDRRAKAPRQEQQPRSQADPPLATFVGKWTGVVKTYRGDVPLRFTISNAGDVQASLGSQGRTLLTGTRFEKDSLTGLMSGDLGTDADTGSDRYDLEFELYLRGGALNGAVTTRPRSGARNFTRLPYWVELKKETSP
ncbi:MAG TPA: serine hydrolase domain-containing protein [Pyrinomonadaceae bacterium]|nr:serine hydrolase domain-containing protein [Pyrinomonadaceae bacterium]